MKRQMFLMNNLNCPTCAAKLEQATCKLPGMYSARVAFGSGSLAVEYDEAVLQEEAIREVVHRLGLEIATVVSRP